MFPMGKVGIVSLLLGSLLLTSCTEVLLFSAGLVTGGVVGYYAGKEGYNVRVEKGRN